KKRHTSQENATTPVVISERSADKEKRGKQKRVSLDDPLHVHDRGVQVRLQRGQGHVHNRAVDKGHTGSEGCGYKHPAPGNFRTRRCSRTRSNYALITRFLENWKHQLISYSLLQSKSRLEYSSRQPSYWHEPTNLAKGHAKHRLAGARPRIFNIGSHQKPLRRRRECVLARTVGGAPRHQIPVFPPQGFNRARFPRQIPLRPSSRIRGEDKCPARPQENICRTHSPPLSVAGRLTARTQWSRRIALLTGL